MAKSNTKPQIEPQLDTEHELPAAEDPAGEGQQAGVSSTNVPGSSTDTETIKAERDALLDRLARTQAEFENARKRAAREQQTIKDLAVADALKALLPILDSFDRAFQSSAQNLEEFRSGMDLIRKQLHDAVRKLGLKPIPAKGERFDPHLHEAVEMVDTTAAEENRVVEELQRGYKLGDRLLRPAMVLVARNPQKERSSEEKKYGS